MKHGRIILETTGDVAVMTLNDPSVLNAFGLKLREDMAVAMDRVEASSARCLRDHRRRARVLLGSQPERSRPRDARPGCRGPRRGQKRPEVLVQSDVHAAARTADSDRHGDQRHGCRCGHEPGIDRRYPHRRAIRVVPAGLRAHRAGAGLRLLLAAASADRHGSGNGIVAAGRTAACRNRVVVGPDQSDGRGRRH